MEFKSVFEDLLIRQKKVEGKEGEQKERSKSLFLLHTIDIVHRDSR